MVVQLAWLVNTKNLLYPGIPGYGFFFGISGIEDVAVLKQATGYKAAYEEDKWKISGFFKAFTRKMLPNVVGFSRTNKYLVNLLCIFLLFDPAIRLYRFLINWFC